eukprot:scaffold517_cov255-Pinguiococcus_pyrenoidosus.AAC.4
MRTTFPRFACLTGSDKGQARAQGGHKPWSSRDDQYAVKCKGRRSVEKSAERPSSMLGTSPGRGRRQSRVVRSEASSPCAIDADIPSSPATAASDDAAPPLRQDPTREAAKARVSTTRFAPSVHCAD